MQNYEARVLSYREPIKGKMREDLALIECKIMKHLFGMRYSEQFAFIESSYRKKNNRTNDIVYAEPL